MSVIFPGAPSHNQTFTHGNKKWVWDGRSWKSISEGFTGSKGDIGFTGSQGVTGFTGSFGFTGSIGFTGSQGVIGFTGSQGIGFTGSKGDSNPDMDRLFVLNKGFTFLPSGDAAIKSGAIVSREYTVTNNTTLYVTTGAVLSIHSTNAQSLEEDTCILSNTVVITDKVYDGLLEIVPGAEMNVSSNVNVQVIIKFAGLKEEF